MADVTPAAVTIREAHHLDAPAIGETHAEAWRVGYAHIFDAPDLARLTDQRRTTRWPSTFASPTFPATTLLVAERSGQVVGFIHLGPSGTAAAELGEIYSFNVHPAEWGTGTATALMDDAVRALADRDKRAIHLWTFQAAARARRFYERTGFLATGKTKVEGPGGVPPVTEIDYLGRTADLQALIVQRAG